MCMCLCAHISVYQPLCLLSGVCVCVCVRARACLCVSASLPPVRGVCLCVHTSLCTKLSDKTREMDGLVLKVRNCHSD